jgi:protein TonB
MINVSTAKSPRNQISRIIPVDCTFPAKVPVIRDLKKITIASSQFGRLVPLGSTCPVVTGDATRIHPRSLDWSHSAGGSIVPAGSTCPVLSEAAKNQAIELEHSWGLAGRLVPMGSKCLDLAGKNRHGEGSSEPALENAFLSSNRIPAHARQTTILYSVVVHTILIAVLLLLPLWFTDAMDTGKFIVTLLAAPPQLMTAPGPPAAPPEQARAATQPVVRRVFMQRGKLLFPTAIPKHATIISEGALEPALGAIGGVYGGLPGELASGFFSGAAEPPPPLPEAAAPALEQPKRPLEVGGNVKPPKLIYQLDPVYPRLAKQAHIQGDVIMATIINEKGEVTDLKVISGPPLLFAAALNAVREWKFEPTYLNGKPWPVAHEVTIHFRL